MSKKIPNERSVLVFARWAARLSRRVPDKILFNSHAARETHVGIGYDPARCEIVPNGFDTERLRPDPAARRALRDELGLEVDVPLVGLVARFHPQKDHATFCSAARRVARKPLMGMFRFASVGPITYVARTACTSFDPRQRQHWQYGRRAQKVRLQPVRPGRDVAPEPIAIETA